MLLTRHQAGDGARWAVDGRFLPVTFSLSLLLELPRSKIASLLATLAGDSKARGQLLAPLDRYQEVWASGVTFLRSREARQSESVVSGIYARVYDAERPELFFKALGWRVVGAGMPIRIRRDSAWNVPEPELVVVLNSCGEMVAYCAGNDVSSRDIEGENPLYLPQAKIYRGACALGPGLTILGAGGLEDTAISLQIFRGTEMVFEGQTDTSMMKRRIEELSAYLFRELDFPHGAFLMTGAGIVPPDKFTLKSGDRVSIEVGGLILQNEVLS